MTLKALLESTRLYCLDQEAITSSMQAKALEEMHEDKVTAIAQQILKTQLP
ncbi:MAG: hypothetical protein K9M07_06660 [Simkaniaceae bacterium]|nr:hypothetical protein [Simkaniaceae bacterium]MCF7852903.1 hypothetical protein [Simkaniaceae bacterium]